MVAEQQAYWSERSQSTWLIKKVANGNVTMEELTPAVPKNIITRTLADVEEAIENRQLERRRLGLHDKDI